MKKTVLQLNIQEKKVRKKVLVIISRFSGLNSITIDDITGKITVVGEVDIPVMVMKLRKICCVDVISVEDVKPPEENPKPEKLVPPVISENQEYQPFYPNIYYYPTYPYTYYKIGENQPNGYMIL